MTPIKSCKVERFAGLGIKLWFKNGKTILLGDGLFISDGINAHTWIGKRAGDGKSIMLSTNNVKETKVISLSQVTYRRMDNNNFETLKL